jgi:hypothetical protein
MIRPPWTGPSSPTTAAPSFWSSARVASRASANTRTFRAASADNGFRPTASSSSAKACYFGDFTGGTMLGDRKQLEVMTSDIYYFNTDSLAVRGISRFCVNIHLDGRGGNGPIGALLSN